MLQSSRPSPRVPSELLGQIMDYVDDLQTLRHCSLAASCLRPYAQRALFTDVRITIGRGKNNLSKMLECYTTRPYAQHARSLRIKQDGLKRGRSAGPDLLKIITLLSTCREVVVADAPSTSRISSLHIKGIWLSAARFLRIVCAFPCLTELLCEWISLPQFATERGTSVTRTPPLDTVPRPPRFLHMAMRTMALEGLDTVLFPQDTDVSLRSLTMEYCIKFSVWQSTALGNKHSETIVLEIDTDDDVDKVALDGNLAIRLTKHLEGGRWSLFALYVTPSKSRDGAYERIGIIKWHCYENAKPHKRWFKGSEKREILLIDIYSRTRLLLS